MKLNTTIREKLGDGNVKVIWCNDYGIIRSWKEDKNGKYLGNIFNEADNFDGDF